MRHLGRTLGMILAGIVGMAPLSWSYTFTLSPDRLQVKWHDDKFNVVGNPSNQRGFNSGDFYQAVVRSLQRWEEGSGFFFNFDYWQGTDPGEYEPNSEFNGHSSIYFATNANSETGLDRSIIALTQVWYDTDTGKIFEADIVLNDVHYEFTQNPSDTTGYGSGGGNGSKVFIENVITHELGHAFGLSHSGALQSSMFFMEAPDQVHLGCDDISGIRNAYQIDAYNRAGAIQGTIRAPDGRGVFGANVLVVSAARGVVIGTTLTDRDGRYQMSGLEPGAYHILTEPYFPGAGALPDGYSGVGRLECGSFLFSRTFLTEGGEHMLSRVIVQEGGVVDVPSIAVDCANSGAASVLSRMGSTSAPSAPPVNGSQFAFVDRALGDGAPLFYELTGVEGDLHVKALGYSLYSPVGLELQLFDDSLNAVQIETRSPVYESETGFKNFDAALWARGLPFGNYYLRVSPDFISSTYYPAGTVSLDNLPFYVVTGDSNGLALSLASVYPDHARCRLPENFSHYTSPGGDPPRGEGGGGLGFCGSTDSRSGGGASGMEIFSWFLPWLLMGVTAALARRRSRALVPGV